MLPRPFWLRQQGPNACLKELGPKGIGELANWERMIRNRSETKYKMMFHENLLRRSRLDLQKKMEICTNGIPIRRETYKLLTRPPELDYTLIGMVLQIVFMANFWFAVAQQIITLTQVCSGPFFCPARGSALTYPMVAPPYSFRLAGRDTTQTTPPTLTSFAWPWDPSVDRNSKGYRSEWPYFQVEACDPDLPVDQCNQLVKLMPTLDNDLANCQRNLKGKEDFVWDPFRKTLHREYLNCNGKGSEITVTLSDRSIVTYYPKNYEERRTATLKCMDDLMQECDDTWSDEKKAKSEYCAAGCPGADKCERDVWWQNANQKNILMAKIGQCVGLKLGAQVHTCNCHEKEWAHYPLVLFFQGQDSDKLRVCDGGPNKGELCGVANITCQQSANGKTHQCTEKWPDSQPSFRHMNYGCFFSTPADILETEYVYKKCNMREPKQSITVKGGSGAGTTITNDNAQGLLDVKVSKRAALVGIFIFKELGYISAGLTVIAVLLLLLCLGILLSPILALCYVVMTGTSEEGLGTRITVIKLAGTVYGLICTYLFLIFTMVCNLSTTYRSLVMLGSVLRAQVNKSLLDMDAKLTTVSGIIYSLVLLVIIDDTTAGGAPSQTATGLGSALALQLFSLFFKMVQEKVGLAAIAMPLKDLNENRLSKFEIALLWLKIMEDFLPDDIQYNWVHHFNSKQPMMPDFDDPEYRLQDLGEDETGGLDEGHCDAYPWTYVSFDPEVRKNFYMEPLNKHLADRFGHDGQGADFNPRYSSQQTAVQTVMVSQDNLIEFMPGEQTLLV